MAVVFITGGARRIGRGLAHGFAERGWSVGIIYNTSAESAETTVATLRTMGVAAHAEQADVRHANQYRRALDTLSDAIAPPDVLVNNAGIFPSQQPVDELTLNDLRDTMAVNTEPLITGAQWLRSVEPVDVPRRMVTISSLGAFEIWKDRIAYNMSKAAHVNLVKGLARALAPRITVNSVAPGAIVMPDEPSHTDAEVAAMSRIPMGRFGSPADIFDAVWFFSTASPYITGQVLIVDGGYHLVR
ncbi:MAG: SDR family oxidoreductase [Bradyrhizobiaceae bacterium]|nr:SDR family oxidoreductase [Bradyrhizobiaceae bacterium]